MSVINPDTKKGVVFEPNTNTIVEGDTSFSTKMRINKLHIEASELERKINDGEIIGVEFELQIKSIQCLVNCLEIRM